MEEMAKAAAAPPEALKDLMASRAPEKDPVHSPTSIPEVRMPQKA